MNKSFSLKEVFSFAWSTFKERPWFLMVLVGSVVLVSGLLSTISQNVAEGSIIVFLVSLVINVFIDMALVSLALAAHDDVHSVSWGTLWAPKMFWQFLAAAILTGIIVVTGFILLIIPGVIAMLGLMFTKYLVIDRSLGPVDALKESWNITKGSRVRLLGFVLAVIAMNLVGALVIIGLLVTIPITMLAVVHVYRALEHDAHEVVKSPISTSTSPATVSA